MFNFLKTLREISIHQPVKARLCRLVIFLARIQTTDSRCLLDRPLSVREVLGPRAAHLLAIIIVCNLFGYLGNILLGILIFRIRATWREAILINFHPLMHVL